MASIRNIVMVTIMQVAVIVVGVLAAGICHRVLTDHDVAMPLLASMLYWHGVIGLLIPIVWGVGTVVLHLRTNVPDGVKTLAFWLGILILIVMIVFVLYADVTPWFQAMQWNPGGNADD
ncbi:MAG TPA: hypothetical protein VMH87_20690 [Pseudomonadales bacterium]|nr:hypothetical protein [Pseudomonadales bacterium]